MCVVPDMIMEASYFFFIVTIKRLSDVDVCEIVLFNRTPAQLRTPVTSSPGKDSRPAAVQAAFLFSLTKPSSAITVSTLQFVILVHNSVS